MYVLLESFITIGLQLYVLLESFVTIGLQLPVFTTNPESQYVVVGDTLTLMCVAAGTIRSNQWTHNGTTLSSRGRVSITRSGDKLTIRSVTMRDSGIYRCSATGNDGSLLSNPARVMVASDVISCDGKHGNEML